MVSAAPAAGVAKQGCSVNKISRVLATLIALLITSTPVTAQKIYKCKGPDGSTVYQQVQCAHEDGEVVKIHLISPIAQLVIPAKAGTQRHLRLFQ